MPRKLTNDGSKNLCGEKIKELRCAAEPEMSQRILAEKLKNIGIIFTQSDIQRVETGQRFVSDIELKGFAKVFGITVDMLIK